MSKMPDSHQQLIALRGIDATNCQPEPTCIGGRRCFISRAAIAEPTDEGRSREGWEIQEPGGSSWERGVLLDVFADDHDVFLLMVVELESAVAEGGDHPGVVF